MVEARRTPTRTVTVIVLGAVGMVAAVPGFAATLPSGIWVVEGGSAVAAPWWHAIAVAVVGLAALIGAFVARPVAPVLAALTLVTAVPLLGTRWLIVLAWLAIAAYDVMLIVVQRRRAQPVPLGLGAAVALATSAAWLASWASIDTWWFGSVGTVAIILIARHATTSVPVRHLLGALALVLALLAAGAEGWHIRDRFGAG